MLSVIIATAVLNYCHITDSICNKTYSNCIEQKTKNPNKVEFYLQECIEEYETDSSNFLEFYNMKIFYR